MDKNRIRAEVRAKKRQLTEEEIERAGKILCEKLISHPLYRSAETLYGYLSYNQEVRTAPILRQALRDGKRVAVPKIFGNEMRFVLLEELGAVRPGYSGIPEPIADGPLDPDETALLLAPGLAFDPAGHRIGYGRGFYDRYLCLHPHHPTVALCYDFQLYPALETDEYDLPVGLVLSAPVR